MKNWKKYFDVNAIFNWRYEETVAGFEFSVKFRVYWQVQILKNSMFENVDSEHGYFAYKPILDGSNDAGTHLEL